MSQTLPKLATPLAPLLPRLELDAAAAAVLAGAQTAADGIALQKLADPDLDVAPAFALWRRLVLGYVESGGETADSLL